MRLHVLKDKFPKTPILALTATADTKTRDDIAHQLRMNEPHVYLSSFDRPNIKYMIHERINEILQLDQFIKGQYEKETGIVYCLSRKKVEKVTAELQKLGHRSVAYHAGLSVQERESAQRAFNCEDNIIVVATVAFGMGIDRPDVRFVAHLDLPKSIEGYYQETGRAGRDGKAASAWMIYGLQDIIKLSQMLETTDANDDYKKVARGKLDAMLALCETVRCRRKALLGYFEEDLGSDCGNCDTCIDPGEIWDAMVDAQKVLSVIFKTNQIFGAGHLIDILMGSNNAKVKERGHDKLSVHGIGRDKAKNHWNGVLRQLLNAQYIFVKNWDYKSLALTSKSRDLLRGEAPFMMRRTKDVKIAALRAKKHEHMEHDRQDLFEELRGLRREIAEEHHVPPYVIFGDKSLHDMCMLLPRNKSEFLMVNGVGAQKCEKYSDDFLRMIGSYTS
jgi:ATP-dependent DNA helicase RecQ